MNRKAWNIRNIHVYVFQLKPLDLYSCSDRLWLAATHFSVPSIFREHNIGMQLLRSAIKSFVFTHFTIQIYMYINNAIKYVPKRQTIWNNILSIYIVYSYIPSDSKKYTSLWFTASFKASAAFLYIFLSLWFWIISLSFHIILLVYIIY